MLPYPSTPKLTTSYSGNCACSNQGYDSSSFNAHPCVNEQPKIQISSLFEGLL